MTVATLVPILAWLLAAFFAVGSAINLFAPGGIREDYARWGYPDWFRFVTAALEIATAVLLVFPAGRLAGAGLGVAVMAAAAGTTLIHREPRRAIAPTVVLVLSAALAAMLIAGPGVDPL